jgi:NADPH2:quinone reductase
VLADAAFVQPVGSLPLADAAGVPCVYPTAYGVLTNAGRFQGGETVLIHSAAGGVGSAAARIARRLGAASVLGTVGSTEKLALAEKLGYDALFLRDDFTGAALEATSGQGVDLVLDPVGGPVRRGSLDVLAPFGRVVVYGDLGRHGDWQADAWDIWKNNRTLAGYNIGDVARRSPDTLGAHLAHALSALASGELSYQPPTVRPVDEVVHVHQALESGATHGKVVLDVW